MANEFGVALRDYRRNAGISQRELAARIGLDFSYISKIENGRIPAPAADTIVTICQALQIPPEELLALTGKIPTEVQQSISTSKAAQQFLREVQRMDLTDDEWGRVRYSLRNLRKHSR